MRETRALPQLHVVLATLDRRVRLGRQPRPRALGARHRRRPLGASRAAQPRRPAVPRRAAGDVDVHEPARVGLHAARHRRVPARVPGRHRRASARARRSPSGCSTSISAPSAPDWPWFEERRDLLQRAPVAGAARVAASRMDNEEMSAVGAALARVALHAVQRSRRRHVRADRLERLLRARRAAGALRSAAGRGLRDDLGLPRGATA